MTLSLERIVPARKKRVEFLWLKEWVNYSPMFRAIREKAKNKMSCCFWCAVPFIDDERMWLGARKRGGNVTLCKRCAAQALETVEPKEVES